MGDIIPFRIERQDDGELRISDIELAERLGFRSPLDFRKLIRRHAETLREFGILATVARIREGAGRPSRDYWLSEQQAIFLCAKSETETATAITVAVVKQFVEMRRNTQRSLPIREWMQITIISEQVSIWEREFPSGFFDHLHRVLGVTKPGRNNHSNCSHFINRYIYQFLFGKLGLDVIREANPADDDCQRAVRHHQVLKARHKPALRQHIDRIGVMLSLSISLGHFDDQFNRAFPLPNTQIGFMFIETPREGSAA